MTDVRVPSRGLVAFEPSRNRGHLLECGDQCGQIVPDEVAGCDSGQCVGDGEPSRHGDRRRILVAGVMQGEAGADGVHGEVGRPVVRLRVDAVRDDRAGHHRPDAGSDRVVGIDHGTPAQPLEQTQFGVPVVLHGAVVVQVILRRLVNTPTSMNEWSRRWVSRPIDVAGKATVPTPRSRMHPSRYWKSGDSG